MSLFTRLLETVQSWRRRRVVVKPRNKAAVQVEQLDHRQLLTVNFTGNVVTDFPASQSPGTVILNDNPTVVHPLIPSNLQPIIKVSGLDINGIRVSYSAANDTLSIGLQQPDNQKNGNPVIAGDTDNNGSSSTVDPAVLAIDPNFKNLPDMGGSQTMGAFLDLTGSGTPQIVAGISDQANLTNGAKQYQVAMAVVDPSLPNAIPQFGTNLPNYAGNIYLVNDVNHPNMEFSIQHFSQLYQQITGQTLTSTSNIKIGAFGNSGEDGGISEAYFPEQNVNIGQATVPPDCVSNPPILINPHQGRHVNTAHQTNVRVNIFSTSGFDATQIDPSTVRLGGASPIGNFTRRIPGYPFPEETFIFNGLDINLPPGITTATVTGDTYSGTPFSSSIQIFNRNDSFYSARAVQNRDTRLGRMSATELNALAADVAANSSGSQSAVSLTSLSTATPPTTTITPLVTASNTTATPTATPATPAVTVSIPKKNVVKSAHVSKVKVRVRTNAANTTPAAVVASAAAAPNPIASGAA